MSNDLARQARNVAAAGRHGDTTLLHVSNAELQGIESLVPLTRNPHTGMPEAFKLSNILPFLGAAIPTLATGGALGPAAAGLFAGMSPAVAGAIGGGIGGLASGALEGDLGKGIQQGLMGAALGGLGGTVLGSISGGASGGASAASNVAPRAVPVPPVKPAVSAATSASGGISSVPAASVAPAATTAAPAVAGGPLAGRPPTGGIGGLLGNKAALAAAAAPAALSMLGGSGGMPEGAGRRRRPVQRLRLNREQTGAAPDMIGGREQRYFTMPTYTSYRDGGLVRYADGGVASLGAAPMGVANEQREDDRQVIAEAVAAIMGKHPRPKDAIRRFIERFGPEAFEQLMSSQLRRSDGRSDSVPAVNPDGAPAALSEGEYVIPADVVSALGNGSTEAGGRTLDGMVQEVRGAKTGVPAPPPEIEPERVLPV